MRLLFSGVCLFWGSGQKCNQLSCKEHSETTTAEWTVPENSIKNGWREKSVAPTACASNCTNQFANVAKSFSTPFSRNSIDIEHTHTVWMCDHSTNRYVQLTVSATTHASTNANVNIIMAEDISFWAGDRQWNFSAPTCMTWMRIRLILFIQFNRATMGTYTLTNTHSNAWISLSFLIHVHTV